MCFWRETVVMCRTDQPRLAFALSNPVRRTSHQPISGKCCYLCPLMTSLRCALVQPAFRMGRSPWIWIVFFMTVSELQITPYGALYNKLKVRIPGDIMIGALFPIHEQPTVQTAFSRKCGSVREQYGIHRIETLILAIEAINKNPSILPGIKLGVDARDTCWYAPIALEQCMDFIRTAFVYKEYADCLRQPLGSPQLCLPIGMSPSKIEIPIAALIGPGSSEMTKQVQQVLQLFSIPQIGYSATAAELSDIAEYRYFLRVVPSDALQVEVITELLRRFEWNYVALVNSIGKLYFRMLSHIFLFYVHVDGMRIIWNVFSII